MAADFKLRLSDIAEDLQILQPFDGWEEAPDATLEAAATPLVSELTPPVPNLDARAAAAVEFAEELLKSSSGDGDKEPLTLQEIAAVNLYTQSWPKPENSIHARLNGLLRERDRTLLTPWFMYFKLLMKALAKLALPKKGAIDSSGGSSSSKQVVWRGVAKSLGDKYAPLGKKFYWWAFSSTTVNAKTLDNPLFLGQSGDRTLFHITVNSGVSITRYSMFPQEAEILLLPGTRFEVMQTASPAAGLTIVSVEEVSCPMLKIAKTLLPALGEDTAVAPASSFSPPAPPPCSSSSSSSCSSCSSSSSCCCCCSSSFPTTSSAAAAATVAPAVAASSPVRSPARSLAPVVPARAISSPQKAPGQTEYEVGLQHYMKASYNVAKPCFETAAAQGYPAAYLWLFNMYRRGDGMGTRDKEMVTTTERWKSKAASQIAWFRDQVEQDLDQNQKQGHGSPGEALLNLAYCVDFGVGVAQDKAAAAQLYRKAADQGNAFAQSCVGWCLVSGEAVAKNEAEAAVWYRKAADQGHVRAMCNLALCLENGLGVSKNEAEAAAWYRKAADQGCADAQCHLGACLENGSGVTKDAAEAVRWYRKAADQGDAAAQCCLGLCLLNGLGVAKNAADAVTWFCKAADQGNAAAQFNLGGCLIIGNGVAKNEAEALAWYRKAADQGIAAAQYNVGVCFDKGRGVARSEAEALAWYRKAADQGDANAQYNLGVCLERVGKSGVKDALVWYRKAADQGFKQASDRIAVLSSSNSK